MHSLGQRKGHCMNVDKLPVQLIWEKETYWLDLLRTIIQTVLEHTGSLSMY